MTTSKRKLGQTTSAADAAVERLLSGIPAGVLMAACLIGFGV